MTGLLSPAHIAVLLVVLLLVFGAKRLPELGRSLGSGMREFKHSLATDAGDEPASLATAHTPDTTAQPGTTAHLAPSATVDETATPPAA